jgi:hypothetical protein
LTVPLISAAGKAAQHNKTKAATRTIIHSSWRGGMQGWAWLV